MDRTWQIGLTIRPIKSYVETAELLFLGNAIRQGRILPESSLLSKIMSIHVFKTKRSLDDCSGIIIFIAHLSLKMLFDRFNCRHSDQNYDQMVILAQ